MISNAETEMALFDVCSCPLMYIRRHALRVAVLSCGMVVVRDIDCGFA